MLNIYLTVWFMAVGFLLIGCSWVNAGPARKPDLTQRNEWQRDHRTVVHDSSWRARYPSIIRAADGSLLVLFTKMSHHQEDAESGDLVLVRSSDNGESWSNGRVVYQAHKGELRAMGTLTALRSDRIIYGTCQFPNDKSCANFDQ